MNQKSPQASWHKAVAISLESSIRVLVASLLLGAAVFFLYEIEKLRNGIPVEVDWDYALQTIDGFGAMQASEVALTPEEVDFFFSPSGIDLSIVRTAIIPSLQDCKDAEIYLGSLGNKTNPANCQAVNSGPTNRTADIVTVQEAVARGVTTVLAVSGSPPGAMKGNGLYYKGGNFLGGLANYSALASTLAAFCAYAARFGVEVTHISPQNEPDISNQYTSSVWTAEQFHDFIPHFQTALRTSRCPGAKIVFPEPSGFTRNYGNIATTTMTDTKVAPLVGVLAMHGYSGGPVTPNDYGYGQHIWQTEMSGISSPYDGSIEDGLKWATTIHNYLTTGGVSAWLYFSLHNVGGLAVDNNEGLTDQKGNLAKRAYAIGNWSKFVRPGWHRVAIKSGSWLPVTAFQNASGTQATIVIVNKHQYSIKQSFRVGTKMGNVAIPWVTSRTLNLAQQPPVTVVDGVIKYTIPAKSVVTFQSNYAVMPSFLPAVGKYSGLVTIVQNSIGAITCYTEDGSIPATNGSGCATGRVYSGPIRVTREETIRAVSGGKGYTDSSVTSATYREAGVAEERLSSSP